MLQLRIYGDADLTAAAAAEIGGLPGARHVSVHPAAAGTSVLLTADLQPQAADRALSTLERLGVPAEDVTLIRLETIGPSVAAEPIALIWADVLSQARLRAQAPARYLVLMGVSGVIAALAVINDSAVLIVGAMAISPDLLPVTAACTGVVLHRWRLVRRALLVLGFGLAVTCGLAVLTTLLLDPLDLLPSRVALAQIPAAQTHVNGTTVLVALAAGIAGMLAVETRASAAVGVAISVTTVPASAYIGVAIGTGSAEKAWPALVVLAVNVAMMVVGGAAALAVQRSAAEARERKASRAT